MFGKKITNYFENNADIVAVYLFGSYANGKARPCSDIDADKGASRFAGKNLLATPMK